MTAKKYLNQIELLDIKINQKQEELDAIRHRAVSISVSNDSERVQTSGPGDKVGNTVCSAVDLSEEINREIDAFYNVKHEVINQIQGLDVGNHIKVLYKRHIEYKPLPTIAHEMGYAEGYIYQVYDKALKSFAESYKNLVKLNF